MKTSFVLIVALAVGMGVVERSSAAIPGMETLASLILGEMDLNSDGIIDGGEWQAGTAKGFDEIDQNQDGFISEAEIDALSGPISEETGDLGAKLAVVIIKKILMTMDANGDKLISKAEYAAGCDAIFKKLDANNDGQISKEELADLPLRLFQGK